MFPAVLADLGACAGRRSCPHGRLDKPKCLGSSAHGLRVIISAKHLSLIFIVFLNTQYSGFNYFQSHEGNEAKTSRTDSSKCFMTLQRISKSGRCVCVRQRMP